MPRIVTDDEIKGMIEFILTAGYSYIVEEALTAMLFELLALRKKVRDNAAR